MVASFLLLSPLGGGQQTAAKTAIGAMLLAANVVIARTTGDYFDAPAETNPLLNTWSLSVEEQFYLVFPAILLIGWLLSKRARRPEIVPVIVVACVGTFSFALALAGSIGLQIPLMPDSLIGFYGPGTRAWEFAVGAMLALGGARLAVSSVRLALAMMITGAGILAASLWLITDNTPFPGVWTLLPVTGTLLLIAAGSSDTAVSRSLASGPMVAIGDRSYSVYLWHWPFIVFAGLIWPDSPLVLLAAAVVSFIPAYASYRWVEQPIRALPHGGGAPLARLVAVTVIPPLGLAGALGFAAINGFWNTTVQKHQAVIQPGHAGVESGCTEGAWRNPEDCTWNDGAPGQPIYLVGDSNADHFSEALIGASTSASRPLVGLTEDGCSYLPVSLALDDHEESNRCSSYTGYTQDYLVAAEPGLVVIANSYLWFRESRSEGIGALGEPPSHDTEVKLNVLAAGMSSAVRSLQDAGHTVLLVQAIPHWGDQKTSLNWASCSVLDLMTVGCSRTMKMEDVLERQGPVADVVADVALATGATVVDVAPELCPGGTCTSISPDGFASYRDGTHITVEQSKALTGTFESAIAAAG